MVPGGSRVAYGAARRVCLPIHWVVSGFVVWRLHGVITAVAVEMGAADGMRATGLIDLEHDDSGGLRLVDQHFR